MSVYQHVGRFAFQNMTRLYMSSAFRDQELEQEDKLQAGLYEVTAMYIQVYENV